MSSKNQKGQRLIAFIFVNTIQYSRTLNGNIYHSNKRGPPPFLLSDTDPIIGHALAHSVDKTHVLVVTLELIWLLFLNIISFNFAPTQRKSFRFTRFRRTYVNCPVIVLTSHCQSCTVFLLDVCCTKQPRSFLLKLFVANYGAFTLLSTLVALMLLTSRWADRQRNEKQSQMYQF